MLDRWHLEGRARPGRPLIFDLGGRRRAPPGHPPRARASSSLHPAASSGRRRRPAAKSLGSSTLIAAALSTCSPSTPMLAVRSSPEGRARPGPSRWARMGRPSSSSPGCSTSQHSAFEIDAPTERMAEMLAEVEAGTTDYLHVMRSSGGPIVVLDGRSMAAPRTLRLADLSPSSDRRRWPIAVEAELAGRGSFQRWPTWLVLPPRHAVLVVELEHEQKVMGDRRVDRRCPHLAPIIHAAGIEHHDVLVAGDEPVGALADDEAADVVGPAAARR